MSNSDQLYRIRPLVWEQVNRNTYKAKTPFFGTITLHRYSKDKWDFVQGGSVWLDMTKPNLEAAQSAAAHWHRERLAADLLEVTTDCENTNTGG